MDNMGNEPFFSIVTVCLNRANLIRRAIESVLSQNFPDYEHIVVDGGSTDGTLDILKEYKHLRIISEPDDGIYDAMNKGIYSSEGRIVGLLNSDDYYEKDVLFQVYEIFNNYKDIDAVTGGANFIDSMGEEPGSLIFSQPATTDKNLLFSCTYGGPLINAWFFSRSFFNRVGLFNKEFKIAGDKELLIRAFFNKINIFPTKSIFYTYYIHSGSMTMSKDRLRRQNSIRENISIAENYINHPDEIISKYFYDWKFNLESKMIKASMKIKDFGTVKSYFMNIWRRNPLLLLKLFVLLLKK